MSALEASEDEATLQAALNAPEIADGYLEAPEGARILGACEIIAALRGQPSPDLPAIACEWVNDHTSLDVSSLLPLAASKIDRVLAQDSELHELWRENVAEYPIWRGDVLALKARLNARPV